MNTSHNFLNLHVLISHSPSCLNRDDMNMQKSARFGGVRRIRISSQCLKRALRTSEPYAQRLGSPSVRTNRLDLLTAKYVELLKDKFPPELIEQTIGLVAGVEKKDAAKKPKKGAADGESAETDAPAKEEKGVAVAPWSVGEVNRLCQIVQQAQADKLDEKKLAKLVDSESKSLRVAMADALDIALFGRMATSGLMTTIDGAMSVAHVITTHEVDPDIDWFTAVDDLTIDQGETGAGHLNTQEFSAGVFYRYASLNLGQLAKNLGSAPREKALEIGSHLAGLFATVTPSAKQSTFAAHNLADFVMASFSDLPLSFANAFEMPVQRARTGGFLKPSVQALESYAANITKAYGLTGPVAVFSPNEAAATTPRLDTLAALEEWVRKGGQS